MTTRRLELVVCSCSPAKVEIYSLVKLTRSRQSMRRELRRTRCRSSSTHELRRQVSKSTTTRVAPYNDRRRCRGRALSYLAARRRRQRRRQRRRALAAMCATFRTRLIVAVATRRRHVASRDHRFDDARRRLLRATTSHLHQLSCLKTRRIVERLFKVTSEVLEVDARLSLATVRSFCDPI